VSHETIYRSLFLEDRAIPRPWEGDLLRGAGNSHVATLVERHSRFCMLVKVPGKDTATVVAALSQHVRELPATLRRSLNWNRGLELAQHKNFSMATASPLVQSQSSLVI
jgi:IS30 family transposase